MTNLLIVFCKNPTLGKVKTRLAKSIGQEKALLVYQRLLEHTREVAQKCASSYAVYYADFVNENDLWKGAAYKDVQQGADIGERMENAILNALSRGYNSVVLIGSDIYELTSRIADEAFLKLQESDVVIGPAQDGGYYLIGMKKTNHELFKLKAWSTPQVYKDTVDKLNRESLSYSVLEELNDIDSLEDLVRTDLVDGLKIVRT